jgi:hypothetical protein
MYFEVSKSSGNGTLTSHKVMKATQFTRPRVTPDHAIQSLTEAEAKAFKAMHGGWVAV